MEISEWPDKPSVFVRSVPQQSRRRTPPFDDFLTRAAAQDPPPNFHAHEIRPSQIVADASPATQFYHQNGLSDAQRNNFQKNVVEVGYI